LDNGDVYQTTDRFIPFKKIKPEKIKLLYDQAAPIARVLVQKLNRESRSKKYDEYFDKISAYLPWLFQKSFMRDGLVKRIYPYSDPNYYNDKLIEVRVTLDLSEIDKKLKAKAYAEFIMRYRVKDQSLTVHQLDTDFNVVIGTSLEEDLVRESDYEELWMIDSAEYEPDEVSPDTYNFRRDF